MTSHRWARGAAHLALSGALLAASSCADEPREAPRSGPLPAEERADSVGREPLRALPDPPSVDPRIVALGRRLFHDKGLSADGTVSCSSCHDLASGGDDGRARSVGVRGRVGSVNAPSVFNVGLNFVQFWDGRAKTLEEQIDGPVTQTAEMGTSWDQVVAKIRGDREYAAAFGQIFGDGITADNVRAAIAGFERTLLTRAAPFDRWLAGDKGALSAAQKSGYETFKVVGCVACHQGRNAGGNMFQRFGVIGDYFADRGDVTDADYGRFNVTGAEADKFVFRVPSLRNVARTAPYFHDGTASTLQRAVEVMAEYQLGRALSGEQVTDIVAFLESLSGVSPESAESGAR